VRASPLSTKGVKLVALELAESNCVSQGKDVEAGRVEGQTVYNCVKR